MDPRLSFVTLVVRDLVRSRAFYIGGLGWPVEFESPDEVVMVRVAEKVVLSLWQEAAAVGELGPIGRPEGAPPMTLAHNVATPSDVDRVLAEARAAGATVAAEAVAREWGGYPATSQIPTASVGRSPTTPARSARRFSDAFGAGRGQPEEACCHRRISAA
jgi:catechol 2,3-dioxygenase-like lactoylglutathione lyase family enzyme